MLDVFGLVSGHEARSCRSSALKNRNNASEGRATRQDCEMRSWGPAILHSLLGVGSLTLMSLVSSRGKRLWWLLVAALAIGGGWWGKSELERRSNPTQDDGKPLPRPKRNAPYIQSKDPVIAKMVEVAKLTDQDLVYDLGCGDGRIIIAAAAASGCRGVGFDIDPARVEEARQNARQAGVDDRVTIEQHDIFDVDLRPAQVAMMYLLPWMMQDLKPQFEQMQPGSRIISHDFPIDGVEPDAVYAVPLTDVSERHVVYLYTIPFQPKPARQPNLKQ